MKTLICGLAFVVLLAAPAAALPNERPATDPILWNAVKVADAFWTQAGYPPACPASVHVYDDPIDHAWARAPIHGCHVYVQRRVLEGYKRTLKYRVFTVADKRAVYRDLCKIMVHERGHNLGFGHDPSGVMHENFDVASAPGACVAWAVHSVPRKRAETLKRGRR